VWIIALPLAALVAVGVAVVVLRAPLEEAWLHHRLRSSDKDVATAAAEVLIARGDLRALPVLARRDAGSKIVLAERESWLEGDASLADLRKASRGEPIWTLRAVAALGDRAEEALPSLVALVHDDDSAVRFAALLAISGVAESTGGTLPEPSTLLELLASDDDAVGLGAMSLLSRLPRLEVDVARAALRTIVQQYRGLRRVQLLLDSWPQGDDPLPLLETWLDDPALEVGAACTLGAVVVVSSGYFGSADAPPSRDPRGLPRLLRALEHRSSDVRLVAIEYLAAVELELDRAEPAWRAAMRLAAADPDPAVRSAAVEMMEDWAVSIDTSPPAYLRDVAWQLVASDDANARDLGFEFHTLRDDLDAEDVRRLLPLAHGTDPLDAETRVGALRVIAAASRLWYGPPERAAALASQVVPLLIAALDDEDPDRTEAVISALAQIGPAAAAAIPRLTALLPDEDLSLEAKDALASICPHRLPVAPLAAVLGGESSWARRAVLRLVSDVGPHAAALGPAVLDAWRANRQQRMVTPEGPDSSGTSAAEIDLEYEAEMLFEALTRIGPSLADETAPTASDLRELFVHAVERAELGVKVEALDALTAIEPRLDDAHRERLECVWHGATEDRDFNTASALVGLGVVRHDVVDAMLVAARADLFDAESDGCYGSAQSLAMPGVPAAWFVPGLREWLVHEYVQPPPGLDDDDEDDNYYGIAPWSDEAVRILETLGPAGREAAPALAGLVTRPAFASRSAACRALGSVDADGAAALPALTSALRDPQTRLAALDGLLLLGPAAAAVVEAVVPHLDDASPTVRERSAELIGTCFDAAQLTGLAPDRVVAALVRRLDDSRWFVRQRAAWALGELGAHAMSAVAQLRARLDDADSRVAWQARKSLTRIGGRQVR